MGADDVELARMCFFFGAKRAIEIAVHNPVTLVAMAIEVRAFERDLRIADKAA